MGKNDKHVDPVEMAAAPLTGSRTPEEPKADLNPYDALFEAIVFSPSDADREYPDNDKSPTVMSRKIASFQAVFTGGFASTSGSVYVRRNLKTNAKHVEAVFLGTRQASAVKPHDERSKAQRNEWLRRAGEEFVRWRKAHGITGAAKGVRTGAAIPLDDGDDY